MITKRMAPLFLLLGLVSCSDADAQKTPEPAKDEEISLVGYWEAGMQELGGKAMYLQFNQDGTMTHNNSFYVSQTKWMLSENRKILILTTAPNSRQYKCEVRVRAPDSLVLQDAGCLPGYTMVNGMKGTKIFYNKQ